MNKRKLLLLLMVPLAAVLASPPAHAATTAPPTFQMQKTIPIGGEGRWDYVLFDDFSRHLYVTRTTHTQVIDPETGKVVQDITGQQEAHGVTLVPAVNRGFISDSGGKGSIVIFDVKSGKVLGRATAAGADAITYDWATNKVLVSCGDAHKLAVLSPNDDPKNARAELIDLGGKPEAIAADHAGRAFIDIQNKNEIAVIDLKQMKVVAHWPAGSGAEPTALVMDYLNHRLFVGCRNQKMVVMSSENGKVLAELPIGHGVDACAWDAARVFASCGDGTLTVISEWLPGQFRASTVKTRLGARTMALGSNDTIYLPTAEFEPGEGEKRPVPKPGSFMMVVVARNK